MKVLLLTRNHVVRDFVALVTGRMEAVLEVQEHVEEITEEAYEFLLVDDRGSFLEDGLALMERMDFPQSIVLYSEGKENHAYFDHKIKKPFLPSDIQQILESETVVEGTLQKEEQILNLQDIEEIRGLLESEGMEIVSEEELADEIEMGYGLLEAEKKRSVEEELLAALSHMEPKKIRKLLNGAEVTLTIRFPKETE